MADTFKKNVNGEYQVNGFNIEQGQSSSTQFKSKRKIGGRKKRILKSVLEV